MTQRQTISLTRLLADERGFDAVEIETWIAEGWVRPAGAPGAWTFAAIDVARLALIRDLRHEYGVNEEALPVILRLLDQLYDQRRQVRQLCQTLTRLAPPDLLAAMHAALRDAGAAAEEGLEPEQRA
jgi:chaperone modulatory protein CbpM